mmetsp:Transcript_28574/g.51076  ORF Transcript_28574/g.51076 Transcript_28574/m.51076 type:complete len:108 (+) Transcript_28574:37-360(+)
METDMKRRRRILERIRYSTWTGNGTDAAIKLVDLHVTSLHFTPWSAASREVFVVVLVGGCCCWLLLLSSLLLLLRAVGSRAAGLCQPSEPCSLEGETEDLWTTAGAH